MPNFTVFEGESDRYRIYTPWLTEQGRNETVYHPDTAEPVYYFQVRIELANYTDEDRSWTSHSTSGAEVKRLASKEDVP